jgi:hypothetical protein
MDFLAFFKVNAVLSHRFILSLTQLSVRMKRTLSDSMTGNALHVGIVANRLAFQIIGQLRQLSHGCWVKAIDHPATDSVERPAHFRYLPVS